MVLGMGSGCGGGVGETVERRASDDCGRLRASPGGASVPPVEPPHMASGETRACGGGGAEDGFGGVCGRAVRFLGRCRPETRAEWGVGEEDSGHVREFGKEKEAVGVEVGGTCGSGGGTLENDFVGRH